MNPKLLFKSLISLGVSVLISCSSHNQYSQNDNLLIYENMLKNCRNLEPTCVIERTKHDTKNLCINDVKFVDDSYWQRSRKQQALPHFKTLVSPPTSLAVKDILFMQQSASLPFQNNKNDIIDLAKALKSKKSNVKDLPPISVWQDTAGHIWTINHRRLIAMILAKVQQTPVIWADKKTVLANKYEFTTLTGGRIINVWITNNVAMVIKNDNSCKKVGFSRSE